MVVLDLFRDALLTGGVNLRSASRICRWGTAAVLVLISAYGLDLYTNLVTLPKYHLGQLDGAGWIRDQPGARAILDFLKTQPQSIVLQRLADRAYIPAPALTIFSGQTALLGWANHEDTWRGYRADIDQRLDAINRFYSGDLPDAERWLEQNHVKYVLWLRTTTRRQRGRLRRLTSRFTAGISGMITRFRRASGWASGALCFSTPVVHLPEKT